MCVWNSASYNLTEMNDYTHVEPKVSRIVYITYSFDNLTLVCAIDSTKHGHNDRFIIRVMAN